jgi:hypothetical protein
MIQKKFLKKKSVERKIIINNSNTNDHFTDVSCEN